jgi:hypothetical protein
VLSAFLISGIVTNGDYSIHCIARSQRIGYGWCEVNLSGHGLASAASTFDPHDRFKTLTKTRTFQAGPTEGRAFFFLRRAEIALTAHLPRVAVH